MPLKTSHDETPVLNLTPMIDVMFNLIIFFMAATSFTSLERNLELKVPEVAAVNLPLTERPVKRVVNVSPDGTVTLDRQVVSLSQLTKQLAQARSEYQGLGVVVRGDGTARLQSVADVLAACRKSGVTDMSIAVRPGNSRR